MSTSTICKYIDKFTMEIQIGVTSFVREHHKSIQDGHGKCIQQ
ncbi:MAG: hypothetical protein K0S04_4448 [Herbinix sp.]|nr:hypothetical protein [Herbinix sp.]